MAQAFSNAGDGFSSLTLSLSLSLISENAQVSLLRSHPGPGSGLYVVSSRKSCHHAKRESLVNLVALVAGPVLLRAGPRPCELTNCFGLSVRTDSQVFYEELEADATLPLSSFFSPSSLYRRLASIYLMTPSGTK